MRKKRIFFSLMFAFSLWTLMACGHSSNQSSTPIQKESNAPTNMNATRTHKDDANIKYNELTGESSHANNPKNQLPSKLNTTSHSPLIIRTNAIIFATLKYESKQPNTSVDYMSKTMTKKGKEIGFSVLPTSDHKKDYKEGSIIALVGHNDKPNNVTLFRYKIESTNHLSLIDPSSQKVVYRTRIQS